MRLGDPLLGIGYSKTVETAGALLVSPAGTVLIRWALLVCALLSVGGDSDVVRKRVKQGVEQYRKSNYSDAAKAFADAELLNPKNLTIKFNRACAESRIRNRTDALALYRKAAATSDPKLAAAAHYNLGSLEALEAKGIFGGSPDAISGAERERGMKHLTDAVSHFRNSLNADRSNTDARRNIEVIRAWQAKMRKVWKKKDQQKEEQEKQEQEESLAQFVVKLDKAQHAAFEKNSGGRTRPNKESLLEMQSKVSAMLPELPDKVASQFAPQPQAPEDQQRVIAQARELFGELSQQVETAAASAAEALENDQGDESIEFQVDTLDRVNEMLALLSQFPDLVTHSLGLQEQLAGAGGFPTKPVAVPIREGNPLLERQSRVGTLAELLPEKAVRFREAVEKQAQEQPSQDAKAQQRTEGYMTAIERAIELSPRLNAAIEAASAELLTRQVPAASPHMKEALEILKKIAETLPKDESGDQGKNDEKQQENDDEQEGDNKDDPSPKPVDDDNDEKKDGEDQKSEQEQEDEQQKQEQEIRDREAAESLMRQVRDREQSFKELKEHLRAMRARRSRVERDW